MTFAQLAAMAGVRTAEQMFKIAFVIRYSFELEIDNTTGVQSYQRKKKIFGA